VGINILLGKIKKNLNKGKKHSSSFNPPTVSLACSALGHQCLKNPFFLAFLSKEGMTKNGNKGTKTIQAKHGMPTNNTFLAP
jgi:hypothetical protein